MLGSKLVQNMLLSHMAVISLSLGKPCNMLPHRNSKVVSFQERYTRYTLFLNVFDVHLMNMMQFRVSYKGNFRELDRILQELRLGRSCCVCFFLSDILYVLMGLFLPFVSIKQFSQAKCFIVFCLVHPHSNPFDSSITRTSSVETTLIGVQN